jgi:hypothetical protein
MILVVISFALLITSRMYVRTLGVTDQLRISVKNEYKKGEEILFALLGCAYMVTFAMVVVTIISLIIKCL